MPRPTNKFRAKQKLSQADKKISNYFKELNELIDKISMPEPALAYCFQRIEFAQRMGLYCLIMREYDTNKKVTRDAIDSLRLERKKYPIIFRQICGKDLSKDLRKKLESAEKVRDKIMHGSSVKPSAVYNEVIIKGLGLTHIDATKAVEST